MKIRLNRKLWQFAILALFLLTVSSCTPKVDGLSSQPWAYQDLRAIDGADSAITELDILAAYVRTLENSLQVRLDLLDLSPAPEFDLYLALDTRPGETTYSPPNVGDNFDWDTLLIIPASGSIQVIEAQEREALPVLRAGSGVRILRDPIQDTLTIHLNAGILKSSKNQSPINKKVAFKAYLTLAGRNTTVDSIGPFSLNDPPPQPAPALITFWNTFPAYTPAQALRRWDGAHTGPLGGRHGLKYLLKAVNKHEIPVVLLDLNTPAALSALDYLGELENIKDMARRGLVILPHLLPGENGTTSWAVQQAITDNRGVNKAFGIPAQTMAYLPAGLDLLQPIRDILPGQFRAVFIPTNEPGSLEHGQFPESVTLVDSDGLRVIMLPGYNTPEPLDQQATLDGLSLAARRTLIGAAQANNSGEQMSPPRIVALGGNLPTSSWGNPPAALASFNYLKNHHWIQLIQIKDLLSNSLKTGLPAENGDLLSQPPSGKLAGSMDEWSLAGELQNAPRNSLHQATWQTYLTRFAPTYPAWEGLPALRDFYSKQAWSLLGAANWVEIPQSIASCDTDPDHDGQLECILASNTIYALFELDEGGYLSYAFVRAEDQIPHQIIGPTSQFITGLSDPSNWNFERGLRADPQVIPGAFADPLSGSAEPGLARFTVQPDQLVLTSTAGITKNFRLLAGGISVEYSGLSPNTIYTTRIPLVLDPWRRFTPGWTNLYHSSQSPGSVSWAIHPGLVIEMSSSAGIILNDFSESHQFINLPEDPNRDYPPGHSLPFPVALATLTTNQDFTVLIKFSPVN